MRALAGRLIALVPVLLGLSVLTFALLAMVPGDPVVTMLGLEADAQSIATRLVLNKIDRVSPEQRAALAAEYPEALQLSALDASDVTRLHQAIVGFFESDMVEEKMLVPYRSQGVLGAVRDSARVLHEEYGEQGVTLTLRAPKEVLKRLAALAAG